MKSVLALSGTKQAALIRNGEISSAELIATHLDRIDKINPALNAVVEVLGDEAMVEAQAVDARRARGEKLRPFEGVPFSIKDSIEVRGTVCSAGTLGYRDNLPSKADATLVARLRKAGAIPLARTNLPDLLFAFESDNLIFGRTNNPYDVSRTSGGSSGGEAALIAAGGSPFGLGSDAAGSVRLPAHYCGIATIKPTSGRLARTGHVPPSAGWIETLWQIGPMARRVEDLWVMMEAMLGPDGEDRTIVPMPFAGLPNRAPRIAFFVDNGILRADAATADTVRAAAHALDRQGMIVEEFCPPAAEQSFELEMKLLGADGGDGLRAFLKDIGSNRTHPLLDAWLFKLERFRTSVAGFAGYWNELDQFRTDMFRTLQRFDVVISPVAAFPAVPHGASVQEDVFPGFSYSMTYNLTGWPAAVVRCGVSREGLPIGVQIAAAPWREDLALAIAELLESILGGWKPTD